MCVLLIATATAMEKETVRPRSCTPAGGPYGGSVSQSRARVTAGSSGRVWGATLSAGQPRGPRTLTYECRARDADTGAGRAGVATDGPAQCSTFATVAIAGWAIATSGPKKRSLDAVCWTSVGHVMPTRVPGGPAFRQWSRLVPCVRHIAWSNGSDEPSRHPAVARRRKPTRTKRLWRRTRSGRSTRSE